MTSILATHHSTFSLDVVRKLNGPNVWSRCQLLELRLDAANFPFTNWPLADELLKSLGLNPVGPIHSGRAEAVAEWFSTAVIRLQVAAGSPVAYHHSRRIDSDVIEMAVEYEEEQLACDVIETLQQWLRALAQQRPFAAADDWSQLLERAYDIRLGNTTGAIVAAAAARGIPFLRLDDESLVQLGQGRYQRRVRTAITDNTGAIGNSVATDKQLTKRLLQEVGIPMPIGRTVSDALDACRAAEELGWPVVVKPGDADYGDGVSIRLTSAEQVYTAYAVARRSGERVLVERFVPGILYRLLVVGDQLVAAVRRESAFVVGDGRHTILELVDQATRDPHRGRERRVNECPLRADTASIGTNAGGVSHDIGSGVIPQHDVTPWRRSGIAIGDVPAMAVGGLSNDLVPAAGQTVPLRGDVFLRSGGVQADRTYDVHPDIATLAIDAAKIVGLDIAGLDLIAEDIARSPQEQTFAILELNPEPAIILHMAPLCDPPRPVAGAIVELLFAADQTGRVPLIAVLGSRLDMDAAWRVVSERRLHGETVGLASHAGAWLNGRRLGTSRNRVGEHVRQLWRHPRTDIVVVYLTLADILCEGLPFTRCDQLIESETGRESLAELPELSAAEQRRALACLRATLQPIDPAGR